MNTSLSEEVDKFLRRGGTRVQHTVKQFVKDPHFAPPRASRWSAPKPEVGGAVHMQTAVDALEAHPGFYYNHEKGKYFAYPSGPAAAAHELPQPRRIAKAVRRGGGRSGGGGGAGGAGDGVDGGGAGDSNGMAVSPAKSRRKPCTTSSAPYISTPLATSSSLSVSSFSPSRAKRTATLNTPGIPKPRKRVRQNSASSPYRAGSKASSCSTPNAPKTPTVPNKRMRLVPDADHFRMSPRKLDMVAPATPKSGMTARNVKSGWVKTRLQNMVSKTVKNLALMKNAFSVTTQVLPVSLYSSGCQKYAFHVQGKSFWRCTVRINKDTRTSYSRDSTQGADDAKLKAVSAAIRLYPWPAHVSEWHAKTPIDDSTVTSSASKLTIFNAKDAANIQVSFGEEGKEPQRVYKRYQELAVEEDMEHEFKAASDAASQNNSWRGFKREGDAEKNVIAFLNSSKGGTLYLGVDDAGKVQGVRGFDRASINNFRQRLTTMRQSIIPFVDPDLVECEFIPVTNAAEHTCVVEIVVRPGLSAMQFNPYEDSKGKAWMKEAASVSLMNTEMRTKLALKHYPKAAQSEA